jgi:N-acetylmuramic acid 6-phosphate etherase
MVRLGKVYQNRMVDLRPASRKLRARAVRMVAELTGQNLRVAASLLGRSGHRPVVALVMHRLGVNRAEAESLLARRRGPLYRLLESQRRER